MSNRTARRIWDLRDAMGGTIYSGASDIRGRVGLGLAMHGLPEGVVVSRVLGL